MLLDSYYITQLLYLAFGRLWVKALHEITLISLKGYFCFFSAVRSLPANFCCSHTYGHIRDTCQGCFVDFSNMQ